MCEYFLSFLGTAIGEFSPTNCFWLSEEPKEDSVHLFEEEELCKSTNPLSRADILALRNFSAHLVPSIRPTAEEADELIDILLKIKIGDAFDQKYYYIQHDRSLFVDC